MMMNEKEKEKEKEEEEEEEREREEEVILNHFYHQHPLGLTVAGSKSGLCFGCPRMIYPEETAYTCRDVVCRSDDVILHEECAEMPRKITLSMHPQHTLIQNRFMREPPPTCAVCQKDICRIGYYCTSSEPCGFQVHVGCALNIEVVKSEKEKEKEEEGEREEVILDHFYHRHPLSLTVAGSRLRICYGCPRMIYPKEKAYTCLECRSLVILHEECAEMPREISLSMHPQHTLIQKQVRYVPTCAVCQKNISYIGYYCTSSDPCGFQVHVWCAQNIEVVKSCIHPSHPQHQLTLQRRSCSFRCDACGITKKGNSYICSDCQYWIHESCAALPPTKDFPHLHLHHLSLVYHVPLDYIKFDFKCDICFEDLLPRYWVYHCQTCRYVVHVNCATTISNINAVADEDDVIVFPLTDNAVEDLIESFVGGVVPVVNPNGNYKFHNHDHELHLISPALQLQLHDEEEVVNDEDEDEDEDDDDDDDDLSYGKKSELICDWCTMPINSSKKYMSCGECKYFLHLPCYQLPPHLPSHPLHPQPNHDLILQASPKLNFTNCLICWFPTNGIFYKCTKCSYFRADIKCLLSLPDTIKHKSHPYHHLKLLDPHTTYNDYYLQRLCAACGDNIYYMSAYICDRSCQFFLHASCAMLPASVTNSTWDKHPLPLTFHATVNRPGDFYCDVCEEEMHPKRWMYHCHDCDVSIHTRCLPTASGNYRNIKFGQRYLVDGVHHHPLAHQLLPLTKPRCDVCGQRKEYGTRGFQCDTHKCNFFMCFNRCGDDCREAIQAVD